MGNIGKYFGDYLGICSDFSLTNKKMIIDTHINYMLNRTNEMFRYEGLPDTIPKRNIELLIQTHGHCAITEVNGDLYALYGSMGGEPNPYYMPTRYIVANPALNFSKDLEIGSECVVIPNDSTYMGLIPLFLRYAHSLCENEISLNMASINTRMLSLISAGDDRTKEAGEKYLKDIVSGKLGVIAENVFLDGIKSQPYGTTQTGTLTSLIEYEQYLRAGWFNDLGLNANYNMKRESINSGESQLNNDMLMPLVDNMLECRQDALESVNKLYGTNISVKLNSSWEVNEKEIDMDLKEPQKETEEGEENGTNED
ncbi:MAG: hypothetical protein MJZ34_14640 [Paludibacteraceae bacterium]|nr:hypothetical protein [Paludibacteraceae bacterium]